MALGEFKVMTLTDAAAERVREIMANAETPKAGLRVGIKKGGCAGMEYTLDLVDQADPGDDVVRHDDVTVFVDKAATLFLLGTQLDFETTKLRTGFVFNNPNQASACGCGESVELKPAELSELAAARSG